MKPRILKQTLLDVGIQPSENTSHRILSLGAGVQSTTLILLEYYGLIERFDHVIFCDTGWEPDEVYDNLERIKQLRPITIASAGDVREFADDPVDGHKEGRKFHASMPLYTLNRVTKHSGVLRRQCTGDYKILPFGRKARELVGLQKYQRPPQGMVVDVAIGISTDEIQRKSKSHEKWKRHIYPLIDDMGWSRRDCETYLEDKGWTPVRSACIGCPYRSDEEWSHLTSEEWDEVIEFDEKIRSRIHNNEPEVDCYLHPSRYPLRIVKLGYTGNRDSRLDECTGMCST